MWRIAVLLLVLMASANGLWAQGCTMCTQTAAHLGDSGAKSLNFGILYLATIPVCFMVTMAYLWYKKSKR